MKIEVITPSRLAVDDDCSLAVMPTPQGEVGIEDGHAHMMATLVPGEIRLYRDGAPEVFAVSGGVIEVRPNRLIVLADAVEEIEEINVERAEKARRRAEERLERPREGVDIDRAQAALARAINRIRVAKRSQEQ
ncbi:MAG: ATP synthase F1 subunit epsilon [Planctomycetota bacterium]